MISTIPTALSLIMFTSHLILAILWIIYCVLHSLLASIKVKEKMKNSLGADYKYYRLGYTIFAFITLIGLLLYQVNISQALIFIPIRATEIAGSTISIAGLVLMFICIKRYFMSLSGLKSLFKEPETSELIITGVHRYIRHPLYLGTFIFIWGLLLVYPYYSLAIASIVITVYTLIAIRFEEEKLILEFGDDYREYMKNVPKIIPRF